MALMTCDTSIGVTQLWRWVGISGLVAEMKSELLLDMFSEYPNNQPKRMGTYYKELHVQVADGQEQGYAKACHRIFCPSSL